MASISTVRAFPNTQVILTIEAAPAVPGASTAGDTSGYSAENRAHSAATDQAQFSTVGTLLAHAMSISDVRWDRIAALQQSISSGSYHVSSAALAGRLIEHLAA